MHVQEAIDLLKANGYKVTKAKATKATAPKLNALGLPMSPSYDPNYRMKYRTPPIKRQQYVGSGISPEKWADMCKAQANVFRAANSNESNPEAMKEAA
jgi:hypothetical protein